MPLGVVLCLVLLKYVPGTDAWQLARLAGIVSFGYAAFLALRLIQGEDAIVVDGWSELRASPLELFAALGCAGGSALLTASVIFNGSLAGASQEQVVAAFVAAVTLAALSAVLVTSCVMVRIRWNTSAVERRDARGRVTAMAWADVVSVRGRWNGVTIATADRRTLTFSPLQSGAGQLVAMATRRARVNARASTEAVGS